MSNNLFNQVMGRQGRGRGLPVPQAQLQEQPANIPQATGPPPPPTSNLPHATPQGNPHTLEGFSDDEEQSLAPNINMTVTTNAVAHHQAPADTVSSYAFIQQIQQMQARMDAAEALLELHEGAPLP